MHWYIVGLSVFLSMGSTCDVANILNVNKFTSRESMVRLRVRNNRTRLLPRFGCVKGGQSRRIIDGFTYGHTKSSALRLFKGVGTFCSHQLWCKTSLDERADCMAIFDTDTYGRA